MSEMLCAAPPGRVPAAALLLSLISCFVLVHLSSTTSPPADLESSVSLERKRGQCQQ